MSVSFGKVSDVKMGVEKRVFGGCDDGVGWRGRKNTGRSLGCDEVWSRDKSREGFGNEKSSTAIVVVYVVKRGRQRPFVSRR